MGSIPQSGRDELSYIKFQRRTAIIETGCVTGRDTAVLRKSRPQLLQRFKRRAVTNKLVLFDNDISLARLDCEGCDLLLELAGLLRHLGLVLRADRGSVLLIAADLPFGGNILRGGPM